MSDAEPANPSNWGSLLYRYLVLGLLMSGPLLMFTAMLWSFLDSVFRLSGVAGDGHLRIAGAIVPGGPGFLFGLGFGVSVATFVPLVVVRIFQRAIPWAMRVLGL